MIKYNVLKLMFILSFILSLILLQSDPLHTHTRIYTQIKLEWSSGEGSNHRIECYTSKFQLIASGLVSDSQFSINDN